MKIDILVKFCTLFSFWLRFQWVVNGSGDQKSSQGSISIWSNGIQCKNRKFFFRGSPELFLHKNAIWDRTPPHLYINCSLHVWGRVQGSQIFKQNSIISIRSKVMAFLVISLSLWFPCCPRCPQVIPTLSPCHPRCPHVIPIAPRRSREGPHGCGLRGLHGLHPMFSPWSLSSPPGPRHPHIIPIIPMSSLLSPHCPHSPQKVHMWSPWLWSPWSPPHVVPVVPIVPTSSLLFPRHPCHPHII